MGWKDPIHKGEPRRTQNPTQSLNSGGIYNVT